MKSHRILLYIILNSVNPLYLVLDKTNVYIKEINESEYLTQIPTDENKYTLKMYGKIWRKNKDDVGSKNNNSCDAKYMKIRFYTDDDLSLGKALDLYDIIIVIRSVFYDDAK